MDLHVLVLAAGLGTRLRPLTEQIAKPLVPIVDASALAHQVTLARTLGDVHLHVNAHHLAEQVREEAGRLGDVRVWEEFPELLGTGGPLHRMWNAGVRGELVVLNGDCYCHADLNAFVQAARSSGSRCALLGRSFPAVDTLRFGNDGYLQGLAGRFGIESSECRSTFTGISWYGSEAWSDIRCGERDIRDAWQRWIAAGCAPWVMDVAGDSLWIDMGSPQGLFDAVMCRLQELRIPVWMEQPSQHRRITDWKNAVVHAGAQIGDGAVLCNTIVLPGAVVAPGEIVDRQIRAKGVTWQL